MLLKSMINLPYKVVKKLIRASVYKPKAYRRLFSLVKDKRVSNLSRSIMGKIAYECFVNKMAPAAAYCEIANFLLNTGQPEVAQVFYQESLNLSLSPATYSLYLQCLLLSPACTDEQMQPVAAKYYDYFLSNINKYESHDNELNPHKKVRVGYLCHFFHNSVSQSLLIPFLREHDRDRIEVYCYSDAESHEVPDSVKKVANVWRDTKFLDDAELAALVRNDHVDVLLELNGHCVVNRYGVMARKAAPIQVSYYNQCGTTGISTIDYNLIGDEVQLDKSAHFYTESIYYIPGAAGIAEFSDDFPACAPPPFLKNGYITFGSFGAAHKVNAQVIKLWCKVLQKIPNARFYMKAGVLSHQNYFNLYQEMFAEQGISLDRIHLEGYSEHKKMLECYANMDIALDSFPHAAGTTTMEATWQGVPVITLCGERYCSQNGRSILSSIGHSELVAYSEEDFINKAIQLANNPQQLIHYRQTLREDFRRSPRGSAAILAKKLDNAYVDMWVRHCKKENVVR